MLYAVFFFASPDKPFAKAYWTLCDALADKGEWEAMPGCFAYVRRLWS